MDGYTRVFVIGNLTKDPEIRTIGNDTKMATFPIAVTEFNKTSYFRVKVFGESRVMVVEGIGKGSRVWVEGRLVNTTYKRKDDTTGYDFYISADIVTVVKRKRAEEINDLQIVEDAIEEQPKEPETDEIPF